jgi:superfamily II DNA or RNA helicase
VARDDLQELFEAVRAACPAGTWSRGVELARGGAVSAECEDADEVVLRVEGRTGLLGPTVILSPDDAEWDCDCGGRDEVCEHVAGAVIALRRARREGLAIGGPRAAAGRIGYRFTRSGGALELARVVVGDGTETPLKSTLSAVTSGRVEGPALRATQEDLEVERVLGPRRVGAPPRGVWPSLLAALSRCPDVRLDGEPVRASVERLGWVGRLEDDGEGFRLAVGRDPRIHETFRDGIALTGGGELVVSGDSGLTGRELEGLTGGRTFPPDAALELVTEVLPSLSQRIPVDVRTGRLPRTTSEPPRLVVEVERRGDALSVLPILVYGDPPTARIDAGRLVPLGGAIPLRDEAAERGLVRRLQNELELLPGRRIDLEGEAAVAFADRLARFGGEVRGRAHEQFHRTAALEPAFTATADGFDLRFALPASTGGARASVDPARVLAAWRRGDELVALPGGGFAPLPSDWLERHGDRVADLLAARGAAGHLPRAALPDLARLCEALDQPVPRELALLRARLEDFDGIAEASLPADVAATLRPYQRRGVDWLCALRELGFGALLADDMGLGKTLQALCALRGRSLVVAPTSVLPNWAEEIARFRPGLRVTRYHGPERRLDPEADLTLTTYAILRLDAEALGAVAWDTVVLDEAQAIKNPDSQVARAAHALRAGFPVALSGTPVENRLDELWSQLHFTNRGLLGTRRDFEERTARPIASGSAEAAARLRARIAPFVLRRTKAEVAPELPPRTDIVLHATLSAAERAIYDAIRAASLREVVERLSRGAGVIQALEVLLRLRQAACHSALVPGQSADTSAKLDVLLEVLESSVADGHKALVFSQWTSLLDLVEPRLERAELAFTRLDGSTRDRGAVVAAFQDPAGPPLLLASLKAGGLGLNLTAADSVFILDPWWNRAAVDQAADRAHRIGQDKPVLVYRLVAEDTVEERILALQERKRGLAAAALGEAGRATAISREELLALLE